MVMKKVVDLFFSSEINHKTRKMFFIWANEDWHKIQNTEIKIKYYGWRIPLFGVFPNIIMSEQPM